MPGRWTIRIAFLLPVLVALGFWMASYSGAMSIRCTFMKRTFAVGAVHGAAGIAYLPIDLPSVFAYAFDPDATRASWKLDGPMGFSFNRGGITLVGFPFWLPTLFFAGVAWFAWRRTRPPRNAAAFPIQPAAAALKSDTQPLP